MNHICEDCQVFDGVAVAMVKKEGPLYECPRCKVGLMIFEPADLDMKPDFRIDKEGYKSLSPDGTETMIFPFNKEDEEQ